MKPLSLKFRFAIAMSIGALGLVIAMGAITMHFAQQDLRATLSSQQLGLVSRTAEHIDDRLRLAVDALAASALALPRDILARPEDFDDFSSRYPTILQLFDEVMLLDLDGRVTAAYPEKEVRLVGLELGTRDYFKRALAGGKPVVSDPLRGKVTGAPLLNVAAPILDTDGRPIGVMVGVMTLARHHLLGNLQAARLGDTGYFTVVATSPEPTYLAHRDPQKLMQKVSIADSPAMATAVGATRAGVTVGRLEGDGEVLIGYQPLAMNHSVLVAVLPAAEAFAAIERTRERTLLIGLIAALVVLPLVWVFAWRLLRPVSTLREEVDAIAADPHGGGLATVRGDEVGRVAHAFNAMLREQRRSEALRIASDKDRRRLVAILESSRDFVAMTDTEGRLTYLNAAGRLCCGVDLNAELGETTLKDYFPPWAVKKLVDEGIPTALADGLWLGETAVLAADRREIPVDQTVIAHRNVDGALDFFSCLLHDTSAAKASTAAMRSSEARMLSIANALPVLVAFIDCDYRYRFVNARYEEHFGVGKSLILGKSVRELIGRAAYETYLPHLVRATGGQMQVFELESHAGVRPVHFLVKLIPQFDDLGALTGFHFIHQDVTDHKVEHQRLSQLVHADPLTGLLNRAGFGVAIEEAMQRSGTHLSAMALFYLDVDRFKSINDRHGHQVGDALLRAFAKRLVGAVRSADVAARLGGDEFVVIAEGLRSIEDVRSIAKKILRAMRDDFDLDGVKLSITASVGIAAYTGGTMKSDELVRRADAALYRAKNAGRDRYDLDDPARDVCASIESGQALELTSIF